LDPKRRGVACLIALSLVIGPLGARAETGPAPASKPKDPAGATAEPSSDEAPAEQTQPEPDGVEKSHVRYVLEGVEIRGNTKTAERVVLRYIPFEPGDWLDVADPELELTRYRLLGTGFFSAVRLSLRKGHEREHAVLVVDVVERNTLVLENVSMGVAADEDTEGNSKPLSPFVGIEAAETNLAGTGITVGAGLGAAADQWALRARFADPAVAGSRWSLNADLLYSQARDFFGNKEVSFESPDLRAREITDYAVVDYKRFGGTIGAGYDLTLSARILFDYRLESIDAIVPTVASHVRGLTREPIDFHILPGSSILSATRAAIVYDTRDAPFLTGQGIQASARVDLALLPLGSSYSFGKLELAYQQWWRLPWSHVVSLSGFVGIIVGDAPFFERFYVGDFTDLLPDRILGLTPDRRQPPNYLGTDIIEVRYGDYAARLQGEYRIPIYTGHGSVYGIDAFADFGLYGVAGKREFTDPPTGYTGAEKVPIDLTYNLGLRVETAYGGFVVAFSNLLGLLPAHGGDRK